MEQRWFDGHHEDSPETSTMGLVAAGPSSELMVRAVRSAPVEPPSPAYWIADDVPFEISFVNDVLPAGRVVRFDPEGLWFVRDAAKSYRHQATVQVYCRCGDWSAGPLEGRLLPVGPHPAGPLLAVKFAPLSTELARQLLAELHRLQHGGKIRPSTAHAPHREEILEADRISQVLSDFAATETWGYLAHAREVKVRVDEVLPSGVVRWRTTGSWTADRVIVDLPGYNSIYRAELQVTARSMDTFVSPLPTQLSRVRHREHRRVGVESSPWIIEFMHPLWDVPFIRRELRDVSIGGLSFAADLGQDLLFIGLRLPLIRVVSPSGRSVRLQGEVRQIRRLPDEHNAVCGLSISATTGAEQDVWTQLVLDTLHEHTASGAPWTEHTWELFTDSGYFTLSGKTPGDFDEIRRRFVAVTRCTSSIAGLSCQAVWPSERGVEAAGSMLKVYEGTWMMHQLAKRPDASSHLGHRRILRDIYLRTFEHIRSDPGHVWTIAYAEASVRWNRRSHLAFARHHADGGRVMSLPLRLMEASCRERGELDGEHFDIGAMTAAERLQLLDVVRRERPLPYREALDLVPERCMLEGIGALWQQAALERGRTFLVARFRGRPIAATILEVGEVGTNLFRLLDSARLFALVPGGERAFGTLIEEARTWFRDLGRESFVYFWEDSRYEAHIRQARLRDLGEGRLWVCPQELVPGFLEHVCQQTSLKRQ